MDRQRGRDGGRWEEMRGVGFGARWGEGMRGNKSGEVMPGGETSGRVVPDSGRDGGRLG